MVNDIFKILTLEEWESASLNGLIVTDLDQRDGFIHLSSAKQLAATLAFYFSDHDNVMLLQINLEAVKEKLIYEPTKQGDRRSGEFAHLYDELKVAHVSKQWTLERGSFTLPEDIVLETEK